MAGTGPTLAGCRLSGGKLTIMFNSSLLSGDKVVLQVTTTTTQQHNNTKRRVER